MSEKKCCVDSCDNSRLNTKEILHIFPKPEKDKERFNIWVKAIGGHILSMDPQRVYDCRRVCNLHFEEKYHTWSKRLSANAIPTLLLHKMNENSGADISLLQYQRRVYQTLSLHEGKSSNIQKPDECASSQLSVPEIDVQENTDEKSCNIQKPDECASIQLSVPEFDVEENTDVPVDGDEAASVQLNDYEDLTLYDDEITKNDQDKQFDGIHEGFCCNICEGPIEKYRYTCIQCNDFDMCSGCEMKGMHSLHYVLRIPAPKPFTEIQEIVTQIREYVMNINKEITIKELETRSRSNSPESHQNDDPLHFVEETNTETESEYPENEEHEEEKSDNEEQGGDSSDNDEQDSVNNDSLEKQDTSTVSLTVEEQSCFDKSTTEHENADDPLIFKELDINSQCMNKAVNQTIQIVLGPSKANVNSDLKRKHQDSSNSEIPSKRAQPAVQPQRKTIPVQKVLSSNQVAILMQNQQVKVLTKVPHKVNLLKKVVLTPQMLSRSVNINQNPTLDNASKCLKNYKNE